MSRQVFSFGVSLAAVLEQKKDSLSVMGERCYFLPQMGTAERYLVVSNCVKPALTTAPG